MKTTQARWIPDQSQIARGREMPVGYWRELLLRGLITAAEFELMTGEAT